MSPTTSNERGRAPLTATEARQLRAALDKDELAIIRETGLTRTPIYRAAAEQPIYAATRYAIRGVLAQLAARST